MNGKQQMRCLLKDSELVDEFNEWWNSPHTYTNLKASFLRDSPFFIDQSLPNAPPRSPTGQVGDSEEAEVSEQNREGEVRKLRDEITEIVMGYFRKGDCLYETDIAECVDELIEVIHRAGGRYSE